MSKRAEDNATSDTTAMTSLAEAEIEVEATIARNDV